jgi:hypothetical protein
MGTMPKSFVPDETDILEQALDDGLDAFAPLAALHDPNGRDGGMWGHRRKIALAEAREAVRNEYFKKCEKITVDRVDDLARMSAQYRGYIDDGEVERTEYHRQKNIRIEHYIRRRELEQRGMR